MGLMFVRFLPILWHVMAEGADAMSDRFPVFEVVLKQRGRRWLWSLCTAEGALVMTGSRSSRAAASYEANRALLLMLQSAPYRSRPSVRAVQADPKVRARRSPEL